MKAGKHVVTANKAVISAYYPELTGLARECGVSLQLHRRRRRGHSVADQSGTVQAAGQHLRAGRHYERHHQLHYGRHARLPGVVPGNFEAGPGAGLCRGGPSADIDGDDVRRKLTISANIAFDALVQEEDIPMFGIRTVTDGDIRAFKAHGFVCKLLATAKATEGGRVRLHRADPGGQP